MTDSLYEGPICDAHHHLWEPTTHAWLAGVEGHPAGDFEPVKTYLRARYAGDAAAAGVTRSVHVQAHHQEALEESRWLSAMGDEADDNGAVLPAAIVAFVDLASENAPEALAAQAKVPRVRGIRFMLDYHPTREDLRQTDRDDHMTSPGWLANFALLSEHDLSFDLQMHSHQAEEAAALVDAHPGTTFVINHMLMPFGVAAGDVSEGEEEGARERWEAGLDLLAARENVNIKLSGVCMFVPEPTAAYVAALVTTVIEKFGAGRCLFGSNFPVDKIRQPDMATYAQWFKAAVADLSASDQELIFWGNAVRVYRIEA